jgi:inner membrane protein
MEPITHLLTGASLGRAGLNRKTAYATLMLTLAAEFPDIDVLWAFKGPVEGMAHHRGFTHSFIGAPVEAAVVLGLIYIVHRWRLKRGKLPVIPPRWGMLFCFGLLAVFSHILLDFTNNYGVRPLMPFNWRWYSWDIVYIVEPVMLLLLIVGLVLPAIFSLVGSEIGEHRAKFRSRWPAAFALCAICAVWWLRDYEHRKAVTVLRSTDYRNEVVYRAAAMPFPINPFIWAGLVETESVYAKVPLDIRDANADPVEHSRLLYKPADTPVTLAAKNSRLGRAYLDWSRFPVVEVEPGPSPREGYIVLFRDLRFDYSPFSLGAQPRGRSPLSARVVLDRNLNVVMMQVGNNQEKP